MKNDWRIWGIVGGVIVIVFGILMFQSRQETVAWGPLFPQPQTQRAEYDFSPKELIVPAEPTKVLAPQISLQSPKPVSAPVAANGKYAIQIASFADQAKADLLKEKASQAGLSAYTSAADLGEKGTWHRVYVGPFANKTEADAALAQVQANFKSGFIISTK